MNSHATQQLYQKYVKHTICISNRSKLRAWSICRNRNRFQIRFSESAGSICKTETGFAKLVKPDRNGVSLSKPHKDGGVYGRHKVHIYWIIMFSVQILWSI